MFVSAMVKCSLLFFLITSKVKIVQLVENNSYINTWYNLSYYYKKEKIGTALLDISMRLPPHEKTRIVQKNATATEGLIHKPKYIALLSKNPPSSPKVLTNLTTDILWSLGHLSLAH